MISINHAACVSICLACVYHCDQVDFCPTYPNDYPEKASVLYLEVPSRHKNSRQLFSSESLRPTTMIDTETAKRLITSGTCEEIQETLNDVSSDTEDPQLLKLLILLHSRLLSLKGDSVESLVVLGRCWMSLGDTKKALGQAQKAVSVDSDYEPAQLLLASAYKLNGAFESAMEVLASIPQTCQCICAIAGVHEAQGNFQDAIELLETHAGTAETAADVALLFGILGTLHEKLGQYEQAVPNLTKAVEHYTNQFGAEHPKTQELAYLLELASSVC